MFWYVLADRVFKRSVAETKQMIPASEVPRWIDYIRRYRKDFSTEEVEHRNLLTAIGQVAYEVATLRYVVSRSEFISAYKGPPPDPNNYLPDFGDEVRRDHYVPPEPKVTREQYEKMSDEEQEQLRKEKSQKAAMNWGAVFGKTLKTVQPPSEATEEDGKI